MKNVKGKDLDTVDEFLQRDDMFKAVSAADYEDKGQAIDENDDDLLDDLADRTGPATLYIRPQEPLAVLPAFSSRPVGGKKKIWPKAQENLVRTIFSQDIASRKCPTRVRCQAVLDEYGTALSHAEGKYRNLVIKVNNMITTAKGRNYTERAPPKKANYPTCKQVEWSRWNDELTL